MPIKPENKHRYPKGWPQIRQRILERAGHRCEWCGVPNYVWRNEHDEWTTDEMRVETWTCVDGLKAARIVLTVAHVHDHDPANCDDDNLAALCQRCHNRHDAPMRRRNARVTRRKGVAVADMFEGDR